jgi:hypothetical protein
MVNTPRRQREQAAASKQQRRGKLPPPHVVDASAVHQVAAAILDRLDKLAGERRARADRAKLIELRNEIRRQHIRVGDLIEELVACCPPGASFRGAPLADIVRHIFSALDYAEADILGAAVDALGCAELVDSIGATINRPAVRGACIIN